MTQNYWSEEASDTTDISGVWLNIWSVVKYLVCGYISGLWFVHVKKLKNVEDSPDAGDFNEAMYARNKDVIR